MYLFNVYNESKDNYHITNILLYLDTNIHFFSKKMIFKNSKNLLHTLFYLSKYLMNQNKNNIFMIRKDWSFWVKNVHFVAELDKKLKILIFIFLKFSSFFSQNIFDFNILLGRGFSTAPNLLKFFKFSKCCNCPKN